MTKRSKTGDGASELLGSEYARHDIAHFEKLMLPFSALGGSRRLGEFESSASAFQYTESDALEFQRLMTFDDERNRSRGSGGRAGRTGYTQADSRLFAEMSRFDHNYVSAAEGDRAKRQAQGPGASAYTQKDLRTFRAMMPGSPEREEQHAAELDSRPVGADRDVGPIRIVDFGEQHSREKDNRRRRSAGMKIRFFD